MKKLFVLFCLLFSFFSFAESADDLIAAPIESLPQAELSPKISDALKIFLSDIDFGLESLLTSKNVINYFSLESNEEISITGIKHSFNQKEFKIFYFIETSELVVAPFGGSPYKTSIKECEIEMKLKELAPVNNGGVILTEVTSELIVTNQSCVEVIE